MTSVAKVRLVGLVLAALASIGVGASPSSAAPRISAASVPASFDCSKATRPVDRFICADAALRWQDLALSRSYRAARDALTGPARAALVAEQRDWLGERDRRCVADRTFAELSTVSELHDQAYDCLMTVYLNHRRNLDDNIIGPIATHGVTEIDLGPIARARPDLVKNGQVRVAAMRLSPDGTHVAILLPSQELDIPDQLWLYRVADRKLIPVTPPPDRQDDHPANAVAAITALAWQGDSVFVLAALWGEGGDVEQGPTALFTATVDGSRRLRDEPAEAKGRWESVNGGLVIREDEVPRDDAAIDSLRGNEAYLVWTADRGHGTVDLHMRARAPAAAPYLVAWGGWELAQFLFDAPRSRLVYSADTGIVLFDMATRAERRIADTSRGDQPYAVSADLGMAVWSTRNGCGDEFLADPDMDGPERFCLGAMVGAARVTAQPAGR